jgi:chromosome segregation ATPase
MDFREYASHETSTVIARLMASQAEAQTRRAREALEAAARAVDTIVASVGADEEARDLVQRLEAAAGIAVQRVRQEAQKAADALREELAAARRAHAEAEARVEALRAEVAVQTDRAASAEADLDVTIDAHRQIEAELAGLRDLLDATRREATQLAADLEAENAQRAVLTADLAAAAEERARLEADLAAARAAASEAADQRATLQSRLDATRGTLASVEASRAALESSRTALQAELEAAHATTDVTRTELETTRADRDRARQEMLATRTELEAARAAGDAARAAGDAIRADLNAAQAALTRAASSTERTPLVISTAAACRRLGAATSVNELLSALATQVSTEFSRAAIFRVKAHHLEGEHAVGFDSATDVSKLILPLTLDSLVTRAHVSGGLVQLRPDDPAGLAPFGGEPHVAVAVPLAFQGENIAVLYADSGIPSAGAHDDRPAFAGILADHATALLSRMSQELKTLHELRDYAAMLLQEAEQMYTADLEGGRSDAERRHRLQDTIDCARQLYTQRAALEGAAAASLLDEQIAAAACATTPFAHDLATLSPQDGARESASRAS